MVLVLWEEEEVGVEASAESGEADHVRLRTASWPASCERVADIARWARADCTVVPRLTLGILTTGLITRRATVVVIASSVERTLAVIDTLASRAPDQRVSPPPRRARTHRAVNT